MVRGARVLLTYLAIEAFNDIRGDVVGTACPPHLTVCAVDGSVVDLKVFDLGCASEPSESGRVQRSNGKKGSTEAGGADSLSSRGVDSGRGVWSASLNTYPARIVGEVGGEVGVGRQVGDVVLRGKGGEDGG